MTQLTVTPDTAGITDVPGFEAAGVPCDLRQKNDPKRLDLALLFSLRPCTAAGTFTKNAVKAALHRPVRRPRMIRIVKTAPDARPRA